MKLSISINSATTLERVHKSLIARTAYEQENTFQSYEDLYNFLDENEEALEYINNSDNYYSISDYFDYTVTQEDYSDFIDNNEGKDEEELNQYFEIIRPDLYISIIDGKKIETLKDWKEVTEYCKEKKIRLPLITYDRNRIEQ